MAVPGPAALALILAALIPAGTRPAAPPLLTEPVVVDQIAPAGPTGPASEFVELRDVSAGQVDISNWQLLACVGERTVSLATVPAGTVLAPKGQQGQYFLIASRYYDSQYATPDLDFQTGSIPDTGGVRLTNAGLNVVDSVGFTPGSPCTEVAPATFTPYGAASRDANGTDTGDNAVDFTARPPYPHNSLG